MGSSGLSILDSSRDAVTGVFPDVRGNALQVTGRTLVVGADFGLSSYSDLAPAAATVFVTIGNFFFAPQTVNVAVGDTVQWDYAGGFAMHNVEACDPTPPVNASTYCNANGTAAEGFFTSGPPSASAFTFQQTFTVSGANPYYCVVHVAGGMVGTVNVAAAPPGVPDGTGGSPLLVGKLPLIPNGSRLALSWDTSTCNPIDDHQIVYGFGSGLPASLGGSYTVSGSRCDIGGSPLQPFTWSSVPDPGLQDPSTGLLWFLVLTNDNGSTEGSWGQDAAGNERNGTAASGVCGVITKSLSNLCGR
jgi:plastocyanin